MNKIAFENHLSFKEYLKLIFILTLKSKEIIWHICWIFSFIFLGFLSINDYMKNPESLNLILKSTGITITLLSLYPVFVFYRYKKKYFDKNSLLKEKLNIEFMENDLNINNEFFSKKIKYEKIYEINILKNYTVLYFYNDFLIINTKKNKMRLELNQNIEEIKTKGNTV